MYGSIAVVANCDGRDDKSGRGDVEVNGFAMNFEEYECVVAFIHLDFCY